MTSQHRPGQSAAASFLSRREWLYVLSLLLPCAAYDLALKAHLIFSARQDAGIVEALGLMQIRLPDPQPPTLLEGLSLLQSDLLFNLGYALLWIALFARARSGGSRWIMLGLFHGLTLSIAVINTIAYQYHRASGSTLDFDILVLGLSSLQEMQGLIASETSPLILLLLGVTVLYALVGPLLITTVVYGWQSRRSVVADVPGLSWWGRSGRQVLLGIAAGQMLLLSLLPGGSSAGVSKSFARDAFMHVLLTGVQVAQGSEFEDGVAGTATVQLPAESRLIPTANTPRRNVVLILLESTRAGATTPYNEDLPTTPFLAELAKRSLLVEQAYAVIPHTHNALTAINCGIYPPLDAGRTRLLALPETLPDICLPHLLKTVGYNTVYFMSQTKSFEDSQQIMENLGYEDFYSTEHMDTTGFEPTNYFGYEDEIMLEPSRAWLEAHRDGPFLAAYLTSAPHHDYLAPQQRHGRVAFTDNDLINRYLNAVRNQDFFLKQLFEQYRQLGLYENTVFLIMGDHGQGFGEHGRNGHDNAIYEEGLRIPLLIHDPQRFKRGSRLTGPVSQLDMLPTVADLLGYRLPPGAYNGSSVLRPLPRDRMLMFSCAGDKGCMASLKGTEKYIHHFDDRPEELFDLAGDPAEQLNLAGERAPEELAQRRDELLAWRAAVRAMYGPPAD